MIPTQDRRQFIGTSMAMAGLTTAPGGASAGDPAYGQANASVSQFGAVGDGEADDTAAFERALATLPAGARLVVEGGRRYRLTRSLVIQKPLAIDGGTPDNTEVIFAAGAYAAIGGQSAGVIIPHDRTLPRQGDARRTTITGLTFRNGAASRGPLHGLLIATPTYLFQVNAVGFRQDGFHVEATTKAIGGNANGSSFLNCSARENGGAGFAFAGDDANSCLLMGARAFENRGDGFRDASLIGNIYLGAEAADNRGAGFWSDPNGPNASIYIGCFAEIGQRYELNPRNLVLAPLGSHQGMALTSLTASANGALRTGAEGLVINDQPLAEASARHSPRGRFETCQISLDGLRLTSRNDLSFRISALLSENYIDFLNGDAPVIRFPSRNVDRNVVPLRPWVPNGLTIGASGGAALAGSGPRPPATGTFDRGAIWINDAPVEGGFIGWTCVKGGTPGSWRPFGAIA